jgi:hypothetical protein
MGCLNLACISCRATNPLKKVLDTNVVAPWVECWIEGNNGKISVGNRSSPPDNTAIIKSFQFGLSNGLGCNIEIFDTAGGNFVKFFKQVTHGGLDSIKKYTLKVRWGWQKKDCGGQVAGYSTVEGSCFPNGQDEVLQSCTHTLVIRNVTVNYSAGGFKFILEGTDTIQDLFEGRSGRTIGSASNPVNLVPAVKKFLAQYGLQALFISIDDKNNYSNIKWKVDTPGGDPDQGPRCDGLAWQANGRNAIETVMNWVFSALPNTQNKGIQVFYSDLRGQPTLIFLEATSLPDCNKFFNSTKWNMGTYIVNGGSCTPVISFTPNIKWSAAMAGLAAMSSGGAGGGPVQSGASNLPGCLAVPDYINIGFENIIPSITQPIYWFLLDHAQQIQKRILVHRHANINWSPITAELKIQGDPAYNDPVLMRAKYISVVVMNPYYVAGSGTDLKWQQLAGAECNPILSNKNWMLIGQNGGGVMHDIRDGSYTTTLKLTLPAPGITIPVDAPLGGDNSCPT